MRAGKLRHRVEIQAVTEARDGHGGITRTWTTVVNRWAAIEPLSGQERFSAQQVNPELTHQVRLRYWSGLTPKHRFKHGSRYLSILSIVNVGERNIEQLCQCKEEV